MSSGVSREEKATHAAGERCVVFGGGLGRSLQHLKPAPQPSARPLAASAASAGVLKYRCCGGGLLRRHLGRSALRSDGCSPAAAVTSSIPAEAAE